MKAELKPKTKIAMTIVFKVSDGTRDQVSKSERGEKFSLTRRSWMKFFRAASFFFRRLEPTHVCQVGGWGFKANQQQPSFSCWQIVESAPKYLERMVVHPEKAGKTIHFIYSRIDPVNRCFRQVPLHLWGSLSWAKAGL